GWDNYLVSKNGAYRLYYCTVDGKNYIADGNLDTVVPAARIAGGVEYTPSDIAKLSGNYYYENGEKVTVKPITLRSLSDGGFDVLNDVYLTELLSDEGNDLANKVLSGISLGAIMNGEVNFEEVLSNLPLTDLFDTVSVEDKIMTSLIYRVSGVSAAEGQSYTHTGTYKNNGTGETFAVNIYTEVKDSDNGPVRSITKVERASDGKEVTSITVADLMDGFSVDDIMNDFTVPDFVDVKPTDGIICYLAYGIYGVDASSRTCKIEGEDGKDIDCTFTVNGDGFITSVTRADNGETVAGTPINEISKKINGLSTKLTIRELITNIEEGSILDTLGDYTVNNIEEGINELTIGQIVNCEGENVNSLLVALKDTKIRGLSSKINDLTVSDVMGKEAVEGNFLLKNLADTKISELPEAVSKITINTLYAEEIYKITTDADGKELPESQHIKAEMKEAVSVVTGEKQVVFSEEYVYYTRSGDETSGYKYNIVSVSENLGKLTQAQFNEAPAGTYYTYGKAQGMWEMLLYVDGSEKAYELENLTDMVKHVSDNMNHSKLKDLHNSGLLKFTNPKDLNKLVPVTQEGGGTEWVELGDLELTEALAYLASTLNFGSSVG
ncbi:MAG: hypothetical protein K2N30_00230, partial [Clostridia bacterium]|nr:hypothetical protein [Clostridia bacterium]